MSCHHQHSKRNLLTCDKSEASKQLQVTLDLVHVQAAYNLSNTLYIYCAGCLCVNATRAVTMGFLIVRVRSQL